MTRLDGISLDAEKIRELMADNHILTLRQLSELMMDVSEPVICQCLNKKRDTSLHTAVRLSQVLKVKVEDIIIIPE